MKYNNLHNCINTNSEYQLNRDVFAHHTANFRTGVIDESFARIGIHNVNSLLMNRSNFYNYTIQKTEKNDGDKISIEESFYLLNDLAERRNDVAHGVSSEILQNGILIDYINFFQIYSDSLEEVLNQELLYFESNYSGKLLGKMTNLYHDGKVICVFSNKNTIKVGDSLIGQNESTIVKTKIISIKLNDEDKTFPS